MLYARGWLDGASAEDLVQDAFVALASQREAPGDVKGWLCRCVRNGSISRWRRAGRQRRLGEQMATERSGWFESRADDLIDAAAAAAALGELEEESREVVVLRIWGQMTLREVGEVVGMPVSTVHMKYQQALESLRKRMVRSCERQKD